MINLLTNIIAVFIMLPILCVVVVFIIGKLITKQGKKSFHLSVDISTFLLVLSVYFLSFVIWQRSFFWIILLFTFLMLVVFTFIYWSIKKEIQIWKILKSVWRIHFLIYLALYLILIFYGLAHRIFTNLFAS